MCKLSFAAVKATFTVHHTSSLKNRWRDVCFVASVITWGIQTLLQSWLDPRLVLVLQYQEQTGSTQRHRLVQLIRAGGQEEELELVKIPYFCHVFRGFRGFKLFWALYVALTQKNRAKTLRCLFSNGVMLLWNYPILGSFAIRTLCFFLSSFRDVPQFGSNQWKSPTCDFCNSKKISRGAATVERRKCWKCISAAGKRL